MSTNTLTFESIKTNIQTKQFTLGVVGLGYVGLPLVCEFIESNINVVGFDIVELAPIENMVAPNFLVAKLYYKMLSYKFKIQ